MKHFDPPKFLAPSKFLGWLRYCVRPFLLTINRVTGIGGVVVWNTTIGYYRQNAGKS